MSDAKERAEENRKFVKKIIEKESGEKIIFLFLAALINTTKYFSELCKKHEDMKAWDDLMNDPIVASAHEYLKSFLALIDKDEEAEDE